jgi:hypothetical protein
VDVNLCIFQLIAVHCHSIAYARNESIKRGTTEGGGVKDMQIQQHVVEGEVNMYDLRDARYFS